MGCAIPTVNKTGSRERCLVTESSDLLCESHIFAVVITFDVFSVRDELRLKK
jgi:hypothetical protein